MAVRCERCGRAFQNKYAVWGHLRVCRPGSVEAEPAQPATSAYGLAQPGLEPQFSHELDFEDEPDDDEPDSDTEPEDEPDDEEEPAPAGWKPFLALGVVALGVAVLSAVRNSSRVWIADPHSSGDGSFAVGSAPPGPTPPWREASQMEIEWGLQSGALEPHN